MARARARSRRFRSSSVSEPAIALARASRPASVSASTQRSSRSPAQARGADENVLEDGHAGERARDLERASDAGPGAGMGRHVGDVLAVEQDLPAVGPELPLIRLSIDVLPAPFGPTTPSTSPISKS